MICPARLKVAVIFPELSFFSRTIPRDGLISHRTNTASLPLLSRTPDSWPDLVSKHLRRS
jgi:hypothetical protein